MIQTNPTLQTFADYLAYDDGTDRCFELTNTELIEVPPESDANVIISRVLGLSPTFPDWPLTVGEMIAT